MAAATQMDTDIEAFKVHKEFGKELTTKSSWSFNTIQGLYQGLLALRTFERAVQKVGPEKVTGEAVSDQDKK